MTPEIAQLVHYGLSSAFWLGMTWVLVNGVVSFVTALIVGKNMG